MTSPARKITDPGLSINGRMEAGSEFLAKHIVTGVADDSLALEFSILDSEGPVRDSLEYRPHRYVRARGMMHLLAFTIMVRVIFYRYTVGFFLGKERWLLGPKRMSLFFDRAHLIGHTVRNGVTTSAALDGIYAVPTRLATPATRGERRVHFWLDQPDGQAVRNRLRITYHQIRAELNRLAEAGKKKIDFLVLACGSAQASVEATAHFLRDHPEVEVYLHLVDLSESSLRRAARLAQIRGIDHLVTIHRKNLKTYVAGQHGATWDLIEMVGFLDYRAEDSLIEICAQVKRLLRPGALFVGAHINPSPWAYVVRWVINWPLLIRRPPEQFKQLLIRSGFTQAEIDLVIEPHQIHTVSLCRRLDDRLPRL